MPNENCQKVKLLKLMELLRQETDEDHPIATSEICQRLGEMGISCERRTVGKDMKTLRAQGFEIMSELRGHENCYWISDRSFELPELKILMDAVQAALFIPEDKTEELVAKIAALGGSHQAELLRGNIIRFNTRKHSNHAVYYNVQAIEEAIREKKKISFRYFDLDENLEKAYRMEGGRYHAEPVSLIYEENNYYLLSFSRKYDRMLNYRVDRMDTVRVEDEAVSDEAQRKIQRAGTMVEEAFRMYQGETHAVTLQFHDKLIGMLYDKFGEDLRIRRLDGHTCETRVNVQLSPPFWGWLFMLREDLRITAPAELIEEFRMQLAAANQLYEV
ncbi:MAG: transcriptional regulator [Clostridia bacterium]|nr:transcriptional regulator [Clostridia bacterium]